MVYLAMHSPDVVHYIIKVQKKMFSLIQLLQKIIALQVQF